jgi:hypothetical protein
VATGLYVIVVALNVVAAVFAIFFVGQISRRQEEKLSKVAHLAAS